GSRHRRRVCAEDGSHLVGRAYPKQTEGLAERDLHRLNQSQPRLRTRDSGFVDDTVIAIEAVERAGQLERVGRELVDTIVLTDVIDELWKTKDEPDEIELALVGEQRGVPSVRVDPALGGGAQDARDARVRALHAIDRVFVRLLHRELAVGTAPAVPPRLGR